VVRSESRVQRHKVSHERVSFGLGGEPVDRMGNPTVVESDSITILAVAEVERR